ncbi:amino acid permease [Peribacillus sp. SCS-155]|uniref:amino acid permease n=1 Tax=Peribacillus sedimenti TaxID=3115297 RepID=UPI0039058559
MEKGLSAWQLAMMALGTVVGGSFFLGVSLAVHTAGPSVILSYIVGGMLVYIILYALSEMTIADPEPGSFRTYAEKAFGSGAGFVVGWVYWTGLVLAMSSEATAASILLSDWFPAVSLPLIGSIIIIGVTLINLLGADRLSKLESGLAAVKLLAIAGFVILGVLLIIGLMPGSPRVGAGALTGEPWFPAGLGGIAGSMLIVMFTYAGFEVIGLAASETSDPHKTVPRAITITILTLVGLYIAAITVMLPLLPTAGLTEDVSPLVLALAAHGVGWAGNVMGIVLVTAILSTMLAAMFGLGRMIRSLAEEGHAPSWIKGKGDVPFRGILFSGAAMLAALGLGLLLPKQVYVFLVSSGGFALLFTYIVIVVTHLKFRKKYGCPEKGECRLPGYPYSSWIVIASLIAVIASMPLVPGQGAGLAAGLSLIVLYSAIYWVAKSRRLRLEMAERRTRYRMESLRPYAHVEAAKELSPDLKQNMEQNDESKRNK